MKNEPIAVVGQACRFPGASSPDALWNLLITGGSGISDVPDDRPLEPLSMLHRKGLSLTARAGIVDQSIEFDAGFFRISPEEAMDLDPQQRLILETTWRAFEDAGIPPSSMKGTDSGVFIGGSTIEYGAALQVLGHRPTQFTGTGACLSLLSNRISYVMDFKGPSFTVDTACSSSLVALHNAIRSMRMGECGFAVVGAVNAINSPYAFLGYSRAQMISPRGICATFDESRDGFVRAEGCGVVLLKPFTAALKDGDQVLCCIYGSAINQDGLSNGLPAPNGQAQTAVIHSALADAGLTPNDVDHVETHGTATPLGDEIEVTALERVFGDTRATDRPLVLGAVKTQLGHMEAAAGMGGLLKVIGSLSADVIPPVPGIECLSKACQDAEPSVLVPREPHPWYRQTDRQRFAGVSAFGFGGANAHVVIGDPPTDAVRKSRKPRIKAVFGPESALVLPFSGRTEKARAHAAEAYLERLARPDADDELRAICHAASKTREHFLHRGAVIGSGVDTLQAGLTAFLENAAAPGVVRQTCLTEARVALMLPGQGSQALAMASGLRKTSPVFAKHFAEALTTVDAHRSTPLLDVLDGSDPALLNRTENTQPALFVANYALARLWMSVGVSPMALIGHSVGEIVAATIAGVFDLEAAGRLITRRGELMGAIQIASGMIVVKADEKRVRDLIAATGDQVDIAAVNAEDECVVAGETQALEAFQAAALKSDLPHKPLKVSHAFHSRVMDAALVDLEHEFRLACPKPALIPIASNVTGKLETDVFSSPAYWIKHARQAVAFNSGLNAVLDAGANVILEVGCKSTLGHLVGRLKRAEPPTVIKTLDGRHSEDDVAFARAVANAHVSGVPIDWGSLYGEPLRRDLNIPPYPFQRKRYWRPDSLPPYVHPSRESVYQSTHHPLLGAPIEMPDGSTVHVTQLRLDDHPYLASHTIGGKVIFPAAAFVEMMRAALAREDGTGTTRIHSITVSRPLLLSEDGIRHLRIIVEPMESADHGESGLRRVRIFSTLDQTPRKWIEHACGKGCNRGEAPIPLPIDVSRLVNSRTTPLNGDAIYDNVATETGLSYGPAFRGLRKLWEDASAEKGTRLVAYLEVPPPAQIKDGTFGLHPALLDSAFHAFIGFMLGRESRSAAVVIAGMKRIRILRDGNCSAYAVLRRCRADTNGAQDRSECEFDFALISPDGDLIAEGDGVRVHFLKQGSMRDGTLVQTMKSVPSPTEQNSSASADVILAERQWRERPPISPVFPSNVEPINILSEDHDLEAHLSALLSQVAPGLVSSDRQGNGAIVLLTHANDADNRLQAATAAFQSFSRLLATCREHRNSTIVVITLSKGSRSPAIAMSESAAAIWGAARSLRLEPNSPRLVLIDTQKLNSTVVDAILSVLNDPEAPDELVLRHEYSFARQLEPLVIDAAFRTPHTTRLCVGQHGRLDSLLTETTERRTPAPDEIEVRVVASGLNFRDVLNALGRYPGDPGPIGAEFAGIVIDVGRDVSSVRVGDRVHGIALSSFAGHVTTPAALTAPIPDGLSFCEAATVPVAFLTAQYGLHHVAKLTEGQRVLVHSAAGGVGMAATQIARRAGAEVVGTASTSKSNAIAHDLVAVHSSRDTKYKAAIASSFGDRSIDVALNSLTGEHIPATLSLLRPGGVFLEIGKAEILSADELGQYGKSICYHPFDLAQICNDNPDTIAQMFAEIASGFATGDLKPLPYEAFSFDQAEQAFRHMSLARHTGKVVVKAPWAEAPDFLPTPALAPAHFEKRTWIVTGGTGHVGRHAAAALSAAGAGAVVVTGRLTDSDEIVKAIASLAHAGTTIRYVAADLSDPTVATDKIAATIKDLPPLGGIVHASGVLDVRLADEENEASFHKTFGGKIIGLDTVERLASLQDDVFVLLVSSFAGAFGSPGQVSYSAANAVLDAAAAKLASMGHPAVSLALGPVDGGGMAQATSSAMRSAMERQGILYADPTAIAPYLISAVKFGTGEMMAGAVELKRFAAAFKPRTGKDRAIRTTEKSSNGLASVLKPNGHSSTEGTLALIRDRVRIILQFSSVDEVDPDLPLAELGLDSLGAAELISSLEEIFGISIPIDALFGDASARQLAKSLHLQTLASTPADSDAIGGKQSQC
ncbi:type I polyketide synthase [Cognatiyoonia sp. IB215182]|uniref:type I polyketide synthase n=1 Tax=Cognatiyoonia sp. IB215182 TaxID=3097353 RepID=UPI002A13B6B5|nr:SDR family NAD(P)-dependent oxidoreductase [Cognatiyoonia sp. IB215182]MDX8355330.1 SDR family NAD(P)-dependent oxidoreductase [Cognatiyoonia sp. IB215182]